MYTRNTPPTCNRLRLATGVSQPPE